MINIELPSFDFDFSVIGEEEPAGNSRSKTDKYYDILQPHLPWKSEGVYFLCNEAGPFYIGRSINLNQRVTVHLLGNERSTREYVGDALYVRGFFVQDICDQEIYEAFAIKTYNPICNRAKTERMRGNYKHK
ncbi:GIY-YIG nuclease family protein [Neobacillus mesonae]|nr:GIY-YIG nuclease family protein [Neobacillus mesonae]